MKPLAIDLFCWLGGWTDGLLVEGYDVVGFDIERHQYGDHAYPAQLVIQDVLTLHGSQFKGASIIAASPPCQEYSYMAMPWSIAKEALTTGRRCIQMTPQEFNDARRLFGVGRRGFGYILGYQGDPRNIWVTVKRYELGPHNGGKAIPPTIANLIRMLVWYHEDYGFLPDLDRGQRTRLELSEENRNV